MMHHRMTARLTALAVCAATTLIHTIAGAQPATPIALTPLPVKGKANFDKELHRIEQEQLAKTWVTVEVKDATLAEVVTEIKKQVPGLQTIEIRKEHPARVTFAVENVPAKAVLVAVATLAGCEYLQLDDRFLLSPAKDVTPSEQRESRGSGTIPISGLRTAPQPYLETARAAVNEVQRLPGASAPIANLSPQAQRGLLRMIADLREGNPKAPQLGAWDQVSVIQEADGTTLIIEAKSQDKKHEYRFTQRKD